jgi:peptide-methionine (S)-S-oxide reductase
VRFRTTYGGFCWWLSFWCREPPFDVINGVVSSTSGYIGGKKDSPTYNEVSAGSTGYTEAV